MHKRGVGLLLGLTIAIALVTLYQDYRFDGLIADERAEILTRDRDLGGMTEAALSLHAAQAAAVGAGQATDTWLARVDTLTGDLSGALERSRAATNERIAPAYAAVESSLADVVGADRRIRAAVNRGDRLVAADLVFMDAADATRRLTTAIAEVRQAEAEAAATHIARFRWLRFGMNAIALVFAVVVAVYFSRAARLGKASAPTVAEMLGSLPPAVTSTKAPSATLAGPAAGRGTEPAAPSAAPSAAMSATADLCADLAKVLDGTDVPALLDRTATVLDAKGVVLWAADTTGTTLRPAMSHGYSSRVLARLGTIQIDADNVTARAFRSLEPQALAGAGPSDSGALAVPLVTGGGCVGVLAAETRRSRPAPELVPIARILAAQFSALVTPEEPAEAPARSAQAKG